MSNNHRAFRHELHYITRGGGRPVILVHGIAASHSEWGHLIPDLAACGYHVYAPDLPGHGNSPKPGDAQYYQVESLLVQLETWIESLNLQEPPLLIGHSLGGYLGLAYARDHSGEVRGLVLINPLYSPRQLSPVLNLMRKRPQLGEKALRATPKWVIQALVHLDPSAATQFSPQIRQQIAADYKRASPNIVYLTQSLPDMTASLPLVKAPTLVIWGEKDLSLNPASFPELVKLLPNAAGCPIAGCGHQPHLCKHQEVNRLVLEFMNSAAVAR